MSEKRAGKVVSVTDIGSNFVRMGVYQAGKGGVQRLDYLEVPLRLGHEVFATGRISVSTVRQLSSILRGYAQVMKEYGVTEYRAIATTAMREAKNRAYVLDQLRIQNNLVVEVLEDGEESSLVYSALCRSPLLREESLLSYVGTGSVGLAVWRQGAVDLSCNLTIGFLKLSEMLRGQEELTARFYRVLEEYVENYFQRVALRLDGQTFSRILLSGRQLDSIAALCGGREEKGALVVERRQLEEMYALLKGMNASTVAREMQLSEVVAPPVNLMEILAAQLLLPAEKAAFEQAQRAGAVASSRRLALREGADAAHAERVRSVSVFLFGKLKKLHGINAKRLVLLECAALLHELGHRANVKDEAQAAYDLIKSSYIYGLDDEETMLVAEIARYGNPHRTPDADRPLPENQRLLIDKLAAIMGLADALDITRKGRISDLKVRLEEDKLAVTAAARDDLLLEKWAFQEGGAFFEDAFGIRPVLTHKSLLL